ncbi:protrudin [Terrapene carolina triunguis]|uniref:protrudin n=1 Tax=Terrapene triunguis TaxID=2587831 RepID=UPI0011569DA8|nr:protrudin [Terrapene carolina triunguis]
MPAWFSLCALLVLLPALLGYLRETCRVRRPESELVRQRYHSVRREDLQQVRLARHEAVAEVKRFLIHLEAFLSWLCCACEGAYRVLHWETPALSSQFYGALLGSLCVLYLLPLCWVLALLNSTLFLGNAEFYRGSSPRLSWALRQEDDDVSQCSVEFDIGLPDSSVMSKNEVIRSKVSRLTERLRKRYPSNNFGSCTGCAATFSVLKKRRSCSNCGNSFCSRCCSYKVPKSSMGATAPDAQRETVFVCASCNQALVK